MERNEDAIVYEKRSVDENMLTRRGDESRMCKSYETVPTSTNSSRQFCRSLLCLTRRPNLWRRRMLRLVPRLVLGSTRPHLCTLFKSGGSSQPPLRGGLRDGDAVRRCRRSGETLRSSRDSRVFGERIGGVDEVLRRTWESSDTGRGCGSGGIVLGCVAQRDDGGLGRERLVRLLLRGPHCRRLR